MMTIYVDTLIAYTQKATSGGRSFGSGKHSCHMATDGDVEALHVFAEGIGLKRTWFQNHHSVPHYDLTPPRRFAAVRAGAVEVAPDELVRLCKVTPIHQQSIEDEAYEMWRVGGSMGLGLWLTRYKERTTGKRNYTVQEIGAWVRLVKEMEAQEHTNADAP